MPRCFRVSRQTIGQRVTPICPHTLTNRPVLVSEGSTVEAVLRRGEDAYLTVDGQVGMALQQLDRIRARRADHSVKVIQPQQVRFFEVLRRQMGVTQVAETDGKMTGPPAESE